MKHLLFLLVIINTAAFSQGKQISTEKRQAKKAYELLNDIRKNPKKYCKELGLNNLNLITQTELIWNPTLARIAEFRAQDMAKRNYFDHTSPEGFGPNYYMHQMGYTLNSDWLIKKKANNFESIAANHSTAEEAIKALIIGRGSPGLMHRKHLLGMDQWNGSLKDTGIGFVVSPRGSTYQTYLCIIIAKHDW